MYNAQDVVKDAGENVLFIQLKLKRENYEREKAVIQALAERYPAILRSMRIRFNKENIKTAIGFSSQAWDYLFPNAPKPKELKPFTTLSENGNEMPSLDGDIFIHLRADRYAILYEMATQLMEILSSVTTTLDETFGFRYFEGRAIIGFVDGTEVPVGDEAVEAALIADDEYFNQGSYALAQKWLHNMDKWNHISTAIQEQAIGRKKFNDTELLDHDKMKNAHTVASKVSIDGKEQKIIRMNVPFSQPAYNQTGTFFIGYTKSYQITEAMLKQMLAKNDYLFSFSKILSSQIYFIPSFNVLDDIADGKL